MLKLISATPSLYTRKLLIVLCEKSIPVELITEVPSDSTAQTPKHNPLEKLPVLILEDISSVYESHYILEYIETKFPDRIPILSQDIHSKLFSEKVEVVVDGMCDVLALLLFEKQHAEGSQGQEWKARQMRKVEGEFRALAD